MASEIHLRSGNLPRALEAIRRAVGLDPSNARRSALRARCAVIAGLIPEAAAAADQALANGLSGADDLLMLASVRVRCDDFRGALELYQRVEQVQPGRNELQRGLASVQRFLGNIEAAESACDRAIEANPADYEMLNLRSSLRRQTPESNHVRELEALLAAEINDWRGAVQVHYALAKEHEDLENFDAAFEQYRAGGALRRRHTQYDVNDDVRIFDAIRQAAKPEVLQANEGRGFPSAAPIFVLGLPRTGSTLVERIISSHSAVETAGELNDFAIELVHLAAAKHGSKPDRLELPAIAFTVDMHDLGKRYLAAVEQRLTIASRFIDKLPLNSLYLGYIHLALPNARIVHVRRHPLDTCVAIYKYLFKNAYPFSYNLDDLVTYYLAHHELMEHWQSLLPDGRIFEVRYEDLVYDQKGVTEALLAYLGLPWEDACLDFHLNTQASTTGSATQVRQKLYSSSVGRWRLYASHIKPLIERLRDAGIPLEDV